MYRKMYAQMLAAPAQSHMNVNTQVTEQRDNFWAVK